MPRHLRANPNMHELKHALLLETNNIFGNPKCICHGGWRLGNPLQSVQTKVKKRIYMQTKGSHLIESLLVNSYKKKNRHHHWEPLPAHSLEMNKYTALKKVGGGWVCIGDPH